MTVKLLTEQHLEFLSLKIGCTGSSESTSSHVKIPHCWKSRCGSIIKDSRPKNQLQEKGNVQRITILSEFRTFTALTLIYAEIRGYPYSHSIGTSVSTDFVNIH